MEEVQIKGKGYISQVEKGKASTQKVTTGMRYVGSQEGNFSHIIGVSDKIRYDQSSIERVVGLPSLQKTIPKTIPSGRFAQGATTAKPIGAHPK